MRTTVSLALLVLALALAPLLHAPSAHAQDDDLARGAAARALFQEGVELARGGDYASAVDRFRRAHALRPAAPIAFNLATALVHEGDLVEASEILQRILRDPSVTAQLRTSAERQRDQLAPRLGRLAVRLEGDHGGVRLEIDQRAIPEAAVGAPLPIDPGAHEIRALRDGSEVARDRVEIGEGERRELVLTIPARPVSEPVASALPAPTLSSAPGEAAVASGAISTDPAEPVDGGGGDDGLAIALGIAAGVLVVGAVTVTAVVLTMPETPSPVSGNAMPGVLTW